ncbi:MAG: hypothetical protein IKV67_07630, partial [Paludibacteraceae bacterium]|nr:hypothetical protein [Paludibacteraceae bacterium]
MNYNFLPFAIGIVLVSTGVSAENFEEVSADKVTTKSLTATTADLGGLTINEGLNIITKKSGLTIGVIEKDSEGYRNFIECKDYGIGAYNTMFSVSRSGFIAGTGLCVKESSANHTYSPTLCVKFNDEENLFSFSTSSYPGTQPERYYPIRFSANVFTFDKGDMIVNGTTTLKDSVAIGGSLDVQKETVLDSMLQVKGETVLDSTLQVKGETVLDSTLQVKGETVLDSTLQVKGETVLDSMLQVKGETVLDSTLLVKGETVLDSMLQVKGETVLDSTL